MNFNRLASITKPNSVLDIGAHVGAFAANLRNYCPDAEFLCIEGNKDCIPYIKQQGFNFIEAYLSKENSYRTLYKTQYNSTNTGDSFYRENTQYYDSNNVIITSVETRRLDSLIDPYSSFDLVKIDVQGAEIDVMEGAGDIIANSKFLLLEAAVTNYNEGAPKQQDVINYMNNLGFKDYEIFDEIRFDGVLIQLDLLFYSYLSV